MRVLFISFSSFHSVFVPGTWAPRRLTGLLTNVDVRGVSEYDVLGGDFKIIGLKLTASLKWPLVKASTNYNMTGTLNKEILVYGKGEIK